MYKIATDIKLTDVKTVIDLKNDIEAHQSAFIKDHVSEETGGVL